MTVEIKAYKTNPKPNESTQYIVAEIDGREVRWGMTPEVYADKTAMAAAVEEHADMLLSDSYRREYPMALVTPGDEETEREAWERILAAGADDTLDAEGNPAGVLLENCREDM